jgi:hypothetical protein
MKKILVAFALAAVASTASATIAGGSHDLTKSSYGNSTSLPACQYCHTPHAWVVANVVGGPLWNRNALTQASYSVYTSSGFTTTVTLGAASRVCLSCHDGSTMAAVNNGTTPVGAQVAVAGYANVGTSLTNDHPVGVAYATTFVAGGYKDLASVTYVRLFSGAVECASCHEPHGTSDGIRSGLYFARAVASVDLCAVCHQK